MVNDHFIYQKIKVDSAESKLNFRIFWHIRSFYFFNMLVLNLRDEYKLIKSGGSQAAYGDQFEQI
jgi:hypothetical protein